MEYLGQNKFINHKEEWPDWAQFFVGISGGYQAFEKEEDFNNFLEKYREEHKNDISNVVNQINSDKEEVKRTGRIGF